MSRKAQGLSMNVIIIAAIALLVLVILSIIFIGRMGKTTESIDKCPGVCRDSADECTGTYQKITNDPCTNADGEDTGQVCCVGIGG